MWKMQECLESMQETRTKAEKGKVKKGGKAVLESDKAFSLFHFFPFNTLVLFGSRENHRRKPRSGKRSGQFTAFEFAFHLDLHRLTLDLGF